ncbi:MAG TPA: phospholipase D-like domain-containing protein [Thermoanaerobaculia bacterium]|jgi:cardiolipin synthase|nr:phospholipase D-like domain-containing protein [Thermoanaerobaculia bacterium]
MKRHRRHRFRRFKAVLHPALGRKLPPELRIGKVERLAEALPGGIEDPGFEILLRRIDGAPFLGGNEVEVYFEGRSAFGAMRDAVRAAQREVLLESYIFKDDSTGRLFLAEIEAAACRGIKVRVLADAVGSYETRAEFWQEMESHGIEVFLFHPLFKSLWYQPFRDHRKILVVDREVAFTGGMNIGEEYGSWKRRPRPGETWRDTHVRIAGPGAWEMAVVFSEGWVHAGGEPFEIESLPSEAAEAPGVRVLVLDSRPKRGQAESAAVMAAVAAAAKRTLWITNAYFAPGHRAIKVLGEAAAQGVDVRLLLPGKSDVPIARRAGHGHFGDLLEQGVRIFEYQPAILHAKTLVADGLVSMVGSTNLDFRSFLFNAECDVLMLDAPTASILEKAFRTDLETATEIRRDDWRRRPWTEKLGDRVARWLSPLL